MLSGNQGKTNKTGIQAVGSSVSYLRRYLLTMAFNIVLADDPDDDGEAVRRTSTRQSARSDPSPPPGEVTEARHPLDEQNGAQWMANLQRLLAVASTVTALVELRRDRRVVHVLAPRTGDHAGRSRRQIEDAASSAAHERLAHVVDESDPDPDDTPMQTLLREIAGMDAVTIAGLDASAEWRARVADVAIVSARPPGSDQHSDRGAQGCATEERDMSKASRGRLTHDNELKLIGQLFDLLALLPPDRREWALQYLTSRVHDMPVLARIECPSRTMIRCCSCDRRQPGPAAMGRKPASHPSHPFREDDPVAALLDRLLSVEQIAELIHAHPSTVFRWAREGRFPKTPLIIGGMTRWRARDYNQWVAQQKRSPGRCLICIRSRSTT